MFKTALTITGLALLAAPHAAPARTPAEEVRPVFTHAIPNIPGKSLVAVEVAYPPGGASPPHRHAPSAFIYARVLSGRIESRVDSQPARIYRTGESFFEEPGAHHRVSRNASATQPAKLLAVFVVDTGETHLTTPDRPKGAR